MHNQDSQTKVVGLAKYRAFRCLISALFVAGVSTAFVSVFTIVESNQRPGLFLLLLVTGFIAAQVQERLHRLKGNL